MRHAGDVRHAQGTYTMYYAPYMLLVYVGVQIFTTTIDLGRVGGVGSGGSGGVRLFLGAG